MLPSNYTFINYLFFIKFNLINLNRIDEHNYSYYRLRKAFHLM